MTGKSVDEIATPVIATVLPTDSAQLSLFAQLSDGADIADGRDLADQSELVGVPFIVVSATYRDGIPRREGKEQLPTNYVSLEIVVGDDAALAEALNRAKRRSGKTTELIINNIANAKPCEALVLNDGSTGIYRQITQYLHGKGIITVPPGDEDGIAGATRWDTYRASWRGWNAEETTTPRFDVRYMCPRGLRVSEYEYGTESATTYYIA